jgi:hypothetical protein
VILIPVMNANSQAIEAVLDDELYYLILNWNTTNESWTLDIRNANYEVLIYGVAMIPNYPITLQFWGYAMPPGQLYVLYPKDRNGPIPRNGFEPEQGYEFVYVTAEEILNAQALLDVPVRLRNVVR